MRYRLGRLTWWLRRLRARRILAAGVCSSILVVAAWSLGGGSSAAPGVLTILVAGAFIGPPAVRFWRRHFLRTAPWTSAGGDPTFGGWQLGFEVLGRAGKEPPVRQVGRIIDTSEQFDAGDLFVEAWLLASDASGTWWTVAQEVTESPTGRSAWTSSIDGWLTVADFDRAGRPSPFRAIHRLVAAEFDVPVVNIDLVAWGREPTASGGRNVVSAIVTTDADILEHVAHADVLVEWRGHEVRLDPTGVAEALGRTRCSRWRGGAVVGLLESLERIHPGSWAGIERTVAARWRDKAMFARVERGTEHVTGRVLAAR